jgi:hypothetical protein
MDSGRRCPTDSEVASPNFILHIPSSFGNYCIKVMYHLRSPTKNQIISKLSYTSSKQTI